MTVSGRKGAGLALMAALLLSACGDSKLSNAPGNPVVAPETQMRGLEASLLAKGGSGVQGKVTVYQKADRWQLSLTVFGLTAGSPYRLAFFDNGNCSSPNAFSAGKLWLPPDVPADTQPEKWTPSLHADGRGDIFTVTRLPNPGQRSEEVFRKRSVLIFAGDTVRELRPGVPNEVVACGVFDTIQTLF